MPERLPFPDVAGPAAEATRPPAFDEIVVRARLQRRRRVVAASVATGAVLAVVALGATLGFGDRTATPPVVDHPTPAPSGSAAPTPSPDPAPDADTIVRTGHLVSYAPGAAGVLTVWQTCSEGEPSVCHAAWQLQTSHDTHRELAPGEAPSAHAAGNGFVLTAWNRRGSVIANDRVTALVDGTAGPVTSADALVPTRRGLVVVDPRTARSWPLTREAGVDRWDIGMIAEDGTTWASAVVGGDVWLGWNRGGSWRHHVMPADQSPSLPGYIAVAGTHVASVSGFDGATILPVADLAVTSDGGSTWRDLHQRDLPFRYVDAMAATTGGTLYVLTEDGHGGRGLFRSTDTSWTRFAEMPNPDHLEALVPSGDHVLAQGGSSDAPALFALDDAGHSTPVALSR